MSGPDVIYLSSDEDEALGAAVQAQPREIKRQRLEGLRGPPRRHPDLPHTGRAPHGVGRLPAIVIDLDSESESPPGQPPVKPEPPPLSLSLASAETPPDDDIVELDASEAAKVARFKPTSFEAYPRFNEPAPVAHWGDGATPQVQRQLQQQLELRLTMCRTEKRNIQDEFEKTNVEKSRALQRKLQLAADLEHLSSERAALALETAAADRLLAVEQQIRQRLKEIYDLDTFTLRCLQMLQLLGNRFHVILSNIRAFETRMLVKAEAVEVVDDERDGQVLRQNLMGFANNVYTSPADLNDLQSLLNNIRPDEEEAEGLAATPPQMTVTLLKHQRMGLLWLLRMEHSRAKGGILADDMGLGKTVQAIALLLANRLHDPQLKTTLVVAPVLLLRQWAAEIATKVKPEHAMTVGIYHGAAKRSMARAKDLLQYDVVLTLYGTLLSEWKKHYREALADAKVRKYQNVLPDFTAGGLSYVSPFYDHRSLLNSFYRVVLDEAQAIKNKLSIASKAVHNLRATYRVGMSGTPIQNTVEELYPLIRFLRVRPYNDEVKFRQTFIIPLKAHHDDLAANPALQKLRALLRAILLRRTKRTLIDGKPILDLPEKHVAEVKTEMDAEERPYYDRLEAQTKAAAAKLLQLENLAYSNILVLLLRLRQACCHGYLVEIGEMKKRENDDEEDGDRGRHAASDWARMYDVVALYDPQVVARIQRDAGDGQGAVYLCPLCFDVFGYELIVLFARCGHLICKNCVEEFFERFEEGDHSDGHRVAQCLTCKGQVAENQLVEYTVFHKVVVERWDRAHVMAHFGRDRPRKTTTMHKIKELIQRNEGMFAPLAKMAECLRLCQKIIAERPGEKIIIFLQFLVLFDLMKLTFHHAQIPFLRYDGSMSLDDKNATIKRFYQEDDKKVLMLLLRAGNVGLTLTCALHVIIMDPFWNPYVEEQAQDRAHRIGQQREVFVHRLLVRNTVEDRIMALQAKKKELVGSALDDEGMKKVSRLGRQELGFLFGLNAL